MKTTPTPTSHAPTTIRASTAPTPISVSRLTSTRPASLSTTITNHFTRTVSVLTLLLVVGAVTCSPLPNDLNPALTNDDASSHVEISHEVRHVTFQVSEEVSEATASSQVPSIIPHEDDPPIPTATTPPTVPEKPSSPVTPEKDTQDHLVEDATPESSTLSPKVLEGDTDEKAETEAKVEELQEELSTQVADAAEEIVASDESTQEVDVVVDELDHVTPVEKQDGDGEDEDVPSISLLGVVAEVEELLHETVDEVTKAIELPDEEFANVTSDAEGNEEEALNLTSTSEETPDDSDVTHEVSEVLVSAEAVMQAPKETAEKFQKLVLPSDEPVIEETGEDIHAETVEEFGEKSDDSSSSEPLEEQKRNVDVADLFEEPAESASANADTEKEVLVPEGRENNSEEANRESRVFIEDGYYHSEDSSPSEEEESIVPEETIDHGLESMSMTSPTPEVPQEEDASADALVENTAPLVEEDSEEASTEAPIIGSEEEEEKVENEEEEEEGEEEDDNSTVIAEEKEPSGVEPEVLPSSSTTVVAPLPSEEYEDTYEDPLDVGDLPDFEVTHEDVPSKEHPLPEESVLIPADLPQDHSNKAGGGDSSDLTAGDHMLEVDAGTPRVLPPHQEQVRAAAPDTLTPGCIVGIVFGVLLSLVVLSGVGGFVVWQRRTLNRPKVLGSDRGYAGSDSGGYIDDQVRVSYVNSQIDTPKGSPEDLISLDNDSFLNSLESMTIQNLWTDNIRHTKL